MVGFLRCTAPAFGVPNRQALAQIREIAFLALGAYESSYELGQRFTFLSQWHGFCNEGLRNALLMVCRWEWESKGGLGAVDDAALHLVGGGEGAFDIFDGTRDEG